MNSPSACRVAVVIPARLDSRRLPRKLLLEETGKPLIQHTWEAASRATLPERVIVATDSPEVATAVESSGGTAVMTSAGLRSGTDRVAEAASQLDETEIFVNVQGDEPEIEAETIDDLIRLISESPDLPMATMAVPITDWETLDAPSCVKVVRNQAGDALYFSRAAIPFPRERHDEDLRSDPPRFLQHLGVYAYRRDFLLRFPKIPASSCERLESLEQLRVLEAGYRIRVGIAKHACRGIDTREEYDAFVRRVTLSVD